MSEIIRDIRGIVIHCSATPNTATMFKGEPGKAGFSTPATEINAWHRARGFKRDQAFRARTNPSLDAIGYHFVIGRNGALFTGRHLNEVGAHVAGKNAKTIGICLVGMDSYTPAQWDQLRATINSIRNMPGLRGKPLSIAGHRDLSPDKNGNGKVEKHEWLKTCPGFSVADWLANDMQPLPGHVWERTL